MYDPIEGVGYHVDLGYTGERWSINLDYGDFFPERLGHVPHDRDIHRGLVKLNWHAAPNFELCGITLVENYSPLGFATRAQRRGLMAIVGCQWTVQGFVDHYGRILRYIPQYPIQSPPRFPKNSA